MKEVKNKFKKKKKGKNSNFLFLSLLNAIQQHRIVHEECNFSLYARNVFFKIRHISGEISCIPRWGKNKNLRFHRWFLSLSLSPSQDLFVRSLKFLIGPVTIVKLLRRLTRIGNINSRKFFCLRCHVPFHFQAGEFSRVVSSVVDQNLFFFP